MSTDDVLQRIDAVLDEPVDDSWTRGPDAMRWTAEDPGRWLTAPSTRALGSVRLAGGPSGGPARITDGDRVLMAWDGSALGGVATFVVPASNLFVGMDGSGVDGTITFTPWDRSDADPIADLLAMRERYADIYYGGSARQSSTQPWISAGYVGVDCDTTAAEDELARIRHRLDAVSPRERALEARRRRGTGPAARRLDGRRG